MPRFSLDSNSRRLRPRPESDEPRRILLLCPEALAVSVLCVEDALRTRGYRVQVELGRRARRWVRNVSPGPPSLRVLCVPQIEPALAEQLCQGREDFHIVGLTTPRSVVGEIERIAGRARSSRTPRPSRMILAQPTLMEQSLHVEKRWGWGLGIALAAVALVGLGGVMGASSRPDIPHGARATVQPMMAPVAETVAPRVAPRDSVFSAVAPRDSTMMFDDDEDERSSGSARRSRGRI